MNDKHWLKQIIFFIYWQCLSINGAIDDPVNWRIYIEYLHIYAVEIVRDKNYSMEQKCNAGMLLHHRLRVCMWMFPSEFAVT